MKDHLSRKNQAARTPTIHTPGLFQPHPFAPTPAAQTPETSTPDSMGIAPESPSPTFAIQDPSGTSRQPIQTKLTIGAPNDPYEQEADRVAAQVVQRLYARPEPPPPPLSLQRQNNPEDDELQRKPVLQRQGSLDNPLQLTPILQRQQAPHRAPLHLQPLSFKSAHDETATADLESTINRARGHGQPMDLSLQKRLGSAMGADFSGVTIHTDSQSDQMNRSIQAKAFTTGQDIFFRQGAYQPQSRPGQELIAHELTHVVQQNGATVSRHPANHTALHRQENHTTMGQPIDSRERPTANLSIQRIPVDTLRIQRAPSELQKEIYKKKAEEYEFKLGYSLSKHPLALEGATSLTDKLQALLLAAAKTPQTAYNPGQTSTGRVDTTRIAEVFAGGNLRERMGTIYAFITNYEDAPNSLGGLLNTAMQSPETVQNVGLKQSLWQQEQVDQGNKFRPFNRKGVVADPVRNDRQRPTEKEFSKNLEAYFDPSVAPTPNRVLQRGEVPLSSRELESAFPRETQLVKQQVGGQAWNLLAEDARQARYLAVVGDKPLTAWKGGQVYNKLGPNLQNEAQQRLMRMVAGFSGTTDMYLHLSDYLNLNTKAKEKVRLAALGTMLPARDHSFHEIMTASTEYGLDYTPGPQGYAAFQPFTGPQLKQLVGVHHFPGDYLSQGAENRLAAETADPDVAKLPKLPTRQDFPAPSRKSKTYRHILDTLDAYHAATPVQRYPIADQLVNAIDVWIARDKWFKKDTRRKLQNLRGLAVQCGLKAAKGNTNLLDLEGDSAIARLTYAPQDDEDDTPMGLFATTPEMAQGMSGKSAKALERLVAHLQQKSAQTPEVSRPNTLPEVSQAQIYQTLQTSEDFADLCETTGPENGKLLLRVMIKSMLSKRLVKPAGQNDPDMADYGKLQAGLARIMGNFEGIQVQIDGGQHPRQGNYRVAGGKTATERAVAKKKTLNLGYQLTPLELDVIDGYTGLEYGDFTGGTVSLERKQALISALRKIPKATGPLYRGDYAYTNVKPSVANQHYRKGVTKNITFTSTSKSLADSFVSKRTTAHVYVKSQSAADIEAFSKKTWEQEALFPPTQVRCIGVVDKRQGKAQFDTVNKTLTGSGGLPTVGDQEQHLGQGRSVPMTLEPGAQEEQWQQWYTEKFKNKVWIFWEEV